MWTINRSVHPGVWCQVRNILFRTDTANIVDNFTANQRRRLANNRKQNPTSTVTASMTIGNKIPQHPTLGAWKFTGNLQRPGNHRMEPMASFSPAASGLPWTGWTQLAKIRLRLSALFRFGCAKLANRPGWDDGLVNALPHFYTPTHPLLAAKRYGTVELVKRKRNTSLLHGMIRFDQCRHLSSPGREEDGQQTPNKKPPFPPISWHVTERKYVKDIDCSPMVVPGLIRQLGKQTTKSVHKYHIPNHWRKNRLDKWMIHTPCAGIATTSAFILIFLQRTNRLNAERKATHSSIGLGLWMFLNGRKNAHETRVQTKSNYPIRASLISPWWCVCPAFYRTDPDPTISAVESIRET